MRYNKPKTQTLTLTPCGMGITMRLIRIPKQYFIEAPPNVLVSKLLFN